MEKRRLPDDLEIVYLDENNPTEGHDGGELENMFGNLCDELATDRFWESSTGSTPGEIRAIFRSRPQRIRKRRKNMEINENDPRPHYVDNVAEAYNTGNINQLREVFERQYEPNCIFLQRYTKETPDVPAHREFHSRDHMLEYLSYFFEACPDGILVVTSRKLHIRQDGTSYLVAKLNFNAIWLFKVILRNVLTSTKNLLANFNPLSTLYNYFISNLTPSNSANCHDAVQPPPDAYCSQEPERVPPANTITEGKPEDVEAFKIQCCDPLSSNLANQQLLDDTQMKEEEESSVISDHIYGPSPLSGAEVTYPTSWLNQCSLYAATQSALFALSSSWVDTSDQSTISAASTTYDMSTVTSPIEVSTSETTFTLQPKRHPHRVNIAVSYVAHINENFKIYKAESFVRGEFSVDLWGNYAGQSCSGSAEEEYSDSYDSSSSFSS